MEDNFVHLHVHTDYSLLDGACRIKKLLKRASELGQKAVAITDHGVMYGCVDFYKAAKAQGIKPIIGCEVYVAARTRFDKVYKIDSSSYHLVLLCKNETGYKNLIKLVSLSNIEGFYVKPRIDSELLEKYSEGLVALSACLAGEVPQALLSGDYEYAKEKALYYKSIFGDDYYIEIQNHGIEEQKRILPDLIRLARETGIQLVATNDAHYVEKTDAQMQHILICIQTNHTVNDEDVLEFKTDEFYIKSRSEMEELFSFVPEALDNTVKIAEKCNFDFEFGKTILPNYEPESGESSREFFNRLCREGLKKHYGENPPESISERLNYETEIIEKMGYTNYFLIVYDFINYAKTHGIPVGPGRGSGAGSLAAYCMGITGVDPIKYNLIFERFLNPERVSMPDFDIDFCYEKRQLVIDYVVNKYGSDHVAQIITFGTMAARLAIRDVGRVMALPYQTVDRIAKLIPQEVNMTIERALEVSAELKNIYSADKQTKELVDIARSIEGMPRHASTHAAGVVITREPADTYVPLVCNDGQAVTQYTMTTLEELGLLKMDFLGLRTLTVISDTEEMIRRFEPDFSIDSVDVADGSVYEMLSSGKTEGVFQFESAGMRQALVNLKPRDIEDLIAVISLYRPGPMDSIPKFIENRHHPEKIRYADERLKDILEVTNGCIVYQEQVMQIFRALAGFSYGEADLVRRAMSKKKADVMEREGARFIENCVVGGMQRAVAQSIYDDMASFAAYAFNKSHAAAYALVAYQTAYLKKHYPRQFMAALLTSVLDSTDKLIEYADECHKIGIEVAPPDINQSGVGFSVDGDKIRYGLVAIKNAGRSFVNSVMEERNSAGSFGSLYDFCKRMYGREINRRALENMIKAGCFDGFGLTRSSMCGALERMLNSVASSVRHNIEGQLDLFSGAESNARDDFSIENLSEFPLHELLKYEKEAIGFYISGNPLDKYAGLIESVSNIRISHLTTEYADEISDKRIALVCEISAIKNKTTRNNEQMAFVRVEDRTGSIETLVFPKTLEQCRELVKVGQIVVLRGRVSVKEDEVSIVCDSIESVEKAQKAEKSRNGLFLKFPTRADERFGRICDLLGLCSGDCSVYMYFIDVNKTLKAPASMAVTPTESLLKELKSLLGEDNVKLG